MDSGLLLVVAVTDEAAVSITPSVCVARHFHCSWVSAWQSQSCAQRLAYTGCQEALPGPPPVLRSLCAHSVCEVPPGPQAHSRWVVGLAAARGGVRCAGGAPVVLAIFALMTNTCWPSLGLGESACSRVWFTTSIICLFLLVWQIVHIFSVQVLYDVCLCKCVLRLWLVFSLFVQRLLNSRSS